MKQLWVVCLAVLLALSVCACSAGGEDAVYTVTKNGVDYVVDTENGAISDGTYTYQYTFAGNASGYNIEIIYPDGSAYSWNMHSSGGWGFGSGGGSEDYDADRYVSGEVLCDILTEKAPPGPADSAKVLLSIFIMAIGAVGIFSPQTGWYLSYGWRYRNAEPSDAALLFGRVGGVLAVLFGIVVLFL